MLNYIDITKKYSSNKYLFVCEINYKLSGRVIGHSRVCNPENDDKKYISEIEIEDVLDIKNHYHEILRQSLYKFINLIGSNPEWHEIILEVKPDIL